MCWFSNFKCYMIQHSVDCCLASFGDNPNWNTRVYDLNTINNHPSSGTNYICVSKFKKSKINV